jgi:hypothetical protein
MMGNERASIFGDDQDLDLGDFKPKQPEPPTVKREDVRTVSEGANFRSREPQPPAPASMPQKREPRRYRTGRNQQLNIKARAEAIEAFYQITNQQGWVLGETFERAIEALSRELETGRG